MALSAVTPTVTDYWHDTKREHVIGTIAIGANPGTYAAGGLALSFVGQEFIKSDLKPKYITIFGVGGFIYQYVLSTSKVMIFTGAAAQAALTELATAAVPAGVSGDVIGFYAIFNLL